MKRIGIIGARSRDESEDFFKLVAVLVKVYEEGDVIVSGGCPKGGDRFAKMLVENSYSRIPYIEHLPDKSKLPENPTRKDFARINYARNTLIARDSDVLIACVSEDRTGGTEDTIRKFLKMGKKDVYLC